MDGFTVTENEGTQNGTDCSRVEVTLNEDSILGNHITSDNTDANISSGSILVPCQDESLKVPEHGNRSEEKKDNKCDHNEESLNKKSVWGPHLSKKGEKTEEKQKVNKSSVLSRFAEKLFAGATFKKRNPRKSLVRRVKSVHSESQLEDSFSSLTSDPSQSFSQPEPSLHSQDISVEEENKSDGTINDSLNFDINCSFKVVNTSGTGKQSQPMSFLQKSLSENRLSKPVLVRNVDKGWLERLDKVNSIEPKNKVNSSDSGIELTDSSVVSFEPKSSPQNTANELGFSEDEDLVCDSDSEIDKTQSINSFRTSNTKSFSRLPSASTNVPISDFKRTSVSLSSILKLQTDPLVSKAEKRAVDLEGEATSCSKKSKLDNVSLHDSFNHTYSSSALTSNIESTSQDFSNTSTKRPESKHLAEIQNNTTKKSKAMIQEEVLKKKISSGKVNENFVKINIQKKVFVRGKKTMNFQKYKKQKWKELKKNQSFRGKGLYKCFKCGDIGHFAQDCMKGRC